MEKEIELKICLAPQALPHCLAWLNQLNSHSREQMQLANTYYDTPSHFFQQQKMGLRVRSKNDQHELTLKTQGEIVGGLHIRPEYNLPLESPKPELKRLVLAHNLQIEAVETLEQQLHAEFSTDFNRQTWLVRHGESVIEIALDQGSIKAKNREEAICEMEFELKEGQISDLLKMLEEMPKCDGMWFSALSKAERGYLLAEPPLFAKKVAKLTACTLTNLDEKAQFQLEQAFDDAIRHDPLNMTLIIAYNQLTNNRAERHVLKTHLVSAAYLAQNIAKLKMLL